MDKFDIIILGGQSNADGRGMGPSDKEFIPNERILYLDGKESWGLEKPEELCGQEVIVTHFYDQPTIKIAEEIMVFGSKRASFGSTFAEEYIKAGYLEEDRKLLIIRAAVGGTMFVEKYGWGVGNILHEKMVEYTKYALELNPENRLVAFLWHQGEQETQKQDNSEYCQQLIDMVKDVRKRLNAPMLPFISGNLVPEWNEKHAWKTTFIVESIKKATAEVGYSAFVESEGLPSNDYFLHNGDDVHFSKVGLQGLGLRYFEEYKKLRG